MKGSLKRQQASMDRALARALTVACDQALAEIIGFEWLTHRANYERFPDSLVVTWVFATDQHCKGADLARLNALTQAAFDDAGIRVSDVAAHVALDSEERCTAQHGGDWRARLRSGGTHG